MPTCNTQIGSQTGNVEPNPMMRLCTYLTTDTYTRSSLASGSAALFMYFVFLVHTPEKALEIKVQGARELVYAVTESVSAKTGSRT